MSNNSCTKFKFKKMSNNSCTKFKFKKTLYLVCNILARLFREFLASCQDLEAGKRLTFIKKIPRQ